MTRLLFISQLGEPGTSYDPAIWCRAPGGDDETRWFDACLEATGLRHRIAYMGLHACRGEALPEALDEIDVVVIGGSFASVGDRHPWQQAIAGWLPRWRATGRPLLGICGGHQLVSDTYGGRVGRIAEGPEIGTLPLTLTEAGRGHYLMQGFEDGEPFHFGNFDQVEVAPAGSTVLATRPHMAHAALDHGGHWITTQFHPESTADIMASGWLKTRPDWMPRYHPLARCHLMIRNFLTGSGAVGL